MGTIVLVIIYLSIAYIFDALAFLSPDPSNDVSARLILEPHSYAFELVVSFTSFILSLYLTCM